MKNKIRHCMCVMFQEENERLKKQLLSGNLPDTSNVQGLSPEGEILI